ncbi:MAG: hypothetical protein E7253_02175 [Lachnospiraceae bacterium]|nr:hypothetical protein [Lachnospiraceae bacterium]
MSSNRLILGADIREHHLILSCAIENQKEFVNETFALEKNRDADELIRIIKEFLESRYEHNVPDYLVYSCEDYPLSKCRKIEKAFRQDGLGRSGIRLLSHENSFVHYVMQQKEELHRHTVIGFDFDGKEMTAYRLYYPNKKNKKEMKTEKKVIGAFSLTGETEENRMVLDQKFADLSKIILSKEVVSTVFLTGTGFDGKWMQKSLKVICDGRRAFFGQNLFSSGNCFYGMMLCRNAKEDYTVQSPETVVYESGVMDSGSGESFVPITVAGIPWYEAKGSVDVIMERGGRADIVFVHSQTKEKQVESVDISGLPARPRKTGRLTITVEFTDNQRGVITVLDKGFGAFSPTTHLVFFKEFKLL